MNAEKNILFVGLGSAHGDDQFGWRVADLLRERNYRDSNVTVRHATIPGDLLDWIEDVDELYVCDILLCDGAGGECFRWEWVHCEEPHRPLFPELQRLRSGGSHQLGLPEVLDLASALRRVPCRIIVHAAGGREFSPATALSSQLEPVAARLADSIWEEMHARAIAGAVSAHAG